MSIDFPQIATVNAARMKIGILGCVGCYFLRFRRRPRGIVGHTELHRLIWFPTDSPPERPGQVGKGWWMGEQCDLGALHILQQLQHRAGVTFCQLQLCNSDG